MKKLFLFLAAASISMTASALQDDKQMATLQHGNQTSVFYGVDALVQAYNAAADTLDIITLSGGNFNVPSRISKSLTIYGAGFEGDVEHGIDRTYLNSGLTLIPRDSEDADGQTVKAGVRVNGVRLEGLHVNGDINIGSNQNTPIHNLTIVKCNAGWLNFHVNSYDVTVRQSLFTGSVRKLSSKNETDHNMLICNSYLCGVHDFPASSTLTIDHCICYNKGWAYGAYTYTNDILYRSPNTGSTCMYNVYVSTGNPTQDEHGNWSGVANAGLWAAEGENGNYAEDKDFVLKYPEKYVGNDFTEIGLHGGAYPWNKISSIPRITECSINTQNAANGTIILSLKAEAQTKE